MSLIPIVQSSRQCSTMHIVRLAKRGRRRRASALLRSDSPMEDQQPTLPPARELTDEVDPIPDDSTQAHPPMGQRDGQQEQPHVPEQVIIERGVLETVPPIKKRGRGPAKGSLFERLRKVGKIPLTIKDGHRGPSCENAAVFSSRVSWIVKVHANMKHASWSVMDEKEKLELINRVKEDFELDWTRENHREAVGGTLADRYNAYHYELHKKYKKFDSHEEALAIGMPMVEKSTWEWLCERWSSRPFKDHSRRNTNNRNKQVVKHTSGRKSFARMMAEKDWEEEEDKNMIAFYKKTHWSKKKGKFINATSEHRYNLMLERMHEMETPEDYNEAAALVFKEMLGFKSGYAQGLGHSVIPEPSPSMQKNKAYVHMVEENKRNKVSAEASKTQLEKMGGELEALRKQLTDQAKQIDVITSQLVGVQESQEETSEEA